MIPRTFLAITGSMYLALAIWCSVAPETTSAKVGFELHPGSGESEFVTIYGGLEVGLALIFFMPLVWREATRFSLASCLLVHLSLVAFRTFTLFRFSEIEAFTYRLAIGEWAILLASAVILLTTRTQFSLKKLKTDEPSSNRHPAR